MLPKGRLDALSDGIFAFAMTLLVLDLRLPDGFVPHSAGELLTGLLGLSDNLIAYVISFMVLSLRWLSLARHREGPEESSPLYVRTALLYLFFITLMPFSTMVVGRYGDLPPAVWLYGGNMAVSSLLSWRLTALAQGEGRKVSAFSPNLGGQAVFLGSVALSIVISLVAPGWAMDAYFLNAIMPVLRRVGIAGGATST
jgi:uncharacterized membrane protein